MISHDVNLGPLKSLDTSAMTEEKSNSEQPGGANGMELWPHYTVKGVIKFKRKRSLGGV